MLNKQQLGHWFARTKIDLMRRLSRQQGNAASLLGCHADSIVYLDTETTGLGDTDQIIELAIINQQGQVLFNHRFKPSVPVHPKAAAVHGISNADLDHCLTVLDMSPALYALLHNRHIVAYNAQFDIRLLQQSFAAYEVDTSWLNDVPVSCAMQLAAKVCGSTNRHGTISLINAAKRLGIKWQGKAHSALADAEMTRQVVTAIAKLS